MGCQADWPFVPRTSETHCVVGGYPNERVACTAERYANTDDEVASHARHVCSNPHNHGTWERRFAEEYLLVRNEHKNLIAAVKAREP